MRPRPAVLSAPLCARQKRRSLTLPPVVHIHSERMHRCPTRFLAKNSFDRVWSQPPRTIAKPLGISDVGHAKACRRLTWCCRLEDIGRSWQRTRRSRSCIAKTRSRDCRTGSVLGRDRGNWGPDPVDLSRLTLPFAATNPSTALG